jgi:hypothetical protein
MQQRAWPLCAALAMAAPALLAFNLSPSATFFNQAAALVGWGGFLIAVADGATLCARSGDSGLATLLSSLALLLVSALASPLWAGLPSTLALSSAGMIAAAALAALVGASTQSAGFGVTAFRALCIGMAIAGVASSLIGVVQVVAPQWPDGDFGARTYIAGQTTRSPYGSGHDRGARSATTRRNPPQS